MEITVVDPSPQALEVSRRRFDEVVKRKSIRNPRYMQNMNHLEKKYDVAIVATNADVRKSVVEELLGKSQVKYLILEKVAFQNLTDFKHVIRLLGSKSVKAWVNLPRRVVPFYRKLKRTIRPHEKVYCTVQGGEWGLACNAIHFVDYICFLTEETDYRIACNNLDSKLKESKRTGFVEFTGSLRCHFRNGCDLNLISLSGSTSPILITLFTRSMLSVVEEENGCARMSREESHWKWEELVFKRPYQSELTHKIIEEIIATGNCGLPSIEESYSIHKPLLNSFISHLERITGKKYSSCPIT